MVLPSPHGWIRIVLILEDGKNRLYYWLSSVALCLKSFKSCRSTSYIIKYFNILSCDIDVLSHDTSVL